MSDPITQPLLIDGHPVEVTLHFGHWLPRLLFAGAVTTGTSVYFKRQPTGPDRIAPILPAHELVHVWQSVRLGRWRYRLTALWQCLRYWTKAHRPLEIEAYADQGAVLAGTHPHLEAPWIPTVFHG